MKVVFCNVVKRRFIIQALDDHMMTVRNPDQRVILSQGRRICVQVEKCQGPARDPLWTCP